MPFVPPRSPGGLSDSQQITFPSIPVSHPPAPSPPRSANPPASCPPHSIIDGRYRIVGELGKGGMGTVMLAEDVRLARRVAVKLLGASDNVEFRERFQSEARLLASISHPGVVRVFDFGEWQGRPFLVMEYLDGKTLQQLLLQHREEWMPLDVVLGFAGQLCDALDEVHRHGIIHRDVKPGNIIIRGGVQSVLVDFGLAQSSALRDEKVICGTPFYLAPEDICRRPLVGPDARRSDVYAAAVTIYEMLAGRPPFDGATMAEVLTRHVREPPPSLLERRPDLPVAIESALMRALAKNPRQRQASCAELIEALWDARRAGSTVAPLPSDVVDAPA